MRARSGTRPQAAPSHGGRPSGRSEVRDGMRIDWDVPVRDGRYPVILRYAKGLAFQDGYPSAWERMADRHPDVTAGSTNKYQSWEVVDPEKWVPHDYACVRFDSRGCGITTLHFERGRQPYLILPVIPPRKGSANDSKAPRAIRQRRAKE